MPVLVAGSIATDHLMHFPGKFSEQLSPTSCTACRCRSWSTSSRSAAAASRPTSVTAWPSSAARRCCSVPSATTSTSTGSGSPSTASTATTCTSRRAPHRPLRLHHRRGHVPDRLLLRRRHGRGQQDHHRGRRGRPPAPTSSSSAPTTRTPWPSTAPSAATKGYRFAADPSQQIARMSAEQMLGIIEGADLLFTNEYEKSLLESKTGRSEADIMGMVEVRVTTLGSDGVEIVGRDLDRVHVPVAKERGRLDPTGVGDGFRAGFLTAREWGLAGSARPRSAACWPPWCSRPSAPRSTRSSRGSSPSGSRSPTVTSVRPRCCRTWPAEETSVSDLDDRFAQAQQDVQGLTSRPSNDDLLTLTRCTNRPPRVRRRVRRSPAASTWSARRSTTRGPSSPARRPTTPRSATSRRPTGCSVAERADGAALT